MLALFLISLLVARPAQTEFDRLAEGFRNPPPECRMRMFWRIFGPAWEPSEVDYQLKLMKSAGIGGVVAFFFYPVALDDPAKGIKNERFLSPQFLKTLGYASHKAKELGLRFGVSGGTGWPFGGPTVSIADAAKRIRREIIKPESDGSFPLPTLKEGEQIIAAFVVGENVTGQIDANDRGRGRGRGRFLPNDTGAIGQKPLHIFIASPTRMQVKRPALGGEGFVIDHYDSAVLNRYLNAFVLPMVQVGGIDSIFCDSLEVYNANWTPALPAEFKKRRGYDLIPNLNKLFDGNPDVRFDFWRTLAELHEDRFTKPLADWCHKHGVKLEMEAYGTPPNPLTAARYIDMPCGEQYEWKGFSFSRWAASGAHLAGKRIISAEAWTWLGIPNRLADSLSDFKLASDMHFLAGINDLIGVDFPYSPRSVPPPGWLPYYGPVMNQNNPQWPYFHAFVEYVNRCQWMLRQGKPVADVAIYLPVEDKLATGSLEQMPLDFLIRDHFVTGKPTGEFSLKNAVEHHSNLLHSLIEHGIGFDGIDFWTMIRNARVRDGKLVCGDGEYSIIVLPKVIGIDPDALHKIEEFCKEGGIVVAIGRLPERAYGRQDSEEVRQLVNEMFEKNARVHRYGNGWTVYLSDDLRWFDDHDPVAWQVFGEKGFLDLVDSCPISPEDKEDTTHTVYSERRLPECRLYCFKNFSTFPRSIIGSVRTRWKKPQAAVWDPLSGRIYVAEKTRLSEGPFWQTFDMMLQPGQTVFLVVAERAPAAGTPYWPLLPARSESSPLKGPWRVTFSGLDSPSARTMRNLESWTNWTDARFFSGQATYSTQFELTGPLLWRTIVNLGEVREAAEVKVNGRVAGIAWCAPFEVDITNLIHEGKNTLDITIGNLPVNQYIGLPQEDLSPLRSAYGNRFPDPQEKQVTKEPAPSGLIGPVTLIYRSPQSTYRPSLRPGPEGLGGRFLRQ